MNTRLGALALIALGLTLGVADRATAQQKKFDQDAPARKTVTVGSEIERGRQAVNHAGGTTVNPVVLAKEIHTNYAWRCSVRSSGRVRDHARPRSASSRSTSATCKGY